MPGKTKAVEVLKDIRAGLGYWGLVAKHEISQKAFQDLLHKYVAAGLLDEQEIREARLTAPEAPKASFTCPNCGLTDPDEFDECPKCGIVQYKIRKPPAVGNSIRQHSHSPNRGASNAVRVDCPYCGQMTPAGLTVCDHCGKRLI